MTFFENKLNNEAKSKKAKNFKIIRNKVKLEENFEIKAQFVDLGIQNKFKFLK